MTTRELEASAAKAALRVKNETTEIAVKEGLSRGWPHVHVWMTVEGHAFKFHAGRDFPDGVDVAGNVERIELGDGLVIDRTGART